MRFGIKTPRPGFVVAVFFFLHSVRQTDLRASSGARAWRACATITVRGIVVSEPRSVRKATRLPPPLDLIENAVASEGTSATLLARWRGDVAYGDELHFFGVAQPVEGPRNPGEFDMRRISRVMMSGPRFRQDMRRMAGYSGTRLAIDFSAPHRLLAE